MTTSSTVMNARNDQGETEMSAPDRACPDYPNECMHPWAHARTYAEVKAAQEPDNDHPCTECQRVKALPDMPEMVPNAAEEWQNGFRWGWYYAIKAVREVPRD